MYLSQQKQKTREPTGAFITGATYRPLTSCSRTNSSATPHPYNPNPSLSPEPSLNPKPPRKADYTVVPAVPTFSTYINYSAYSTYSTYSAAIDDSTLVTLGTVPGPALAS